MLDLLVQIFALLLLLSAVAAGYWRWIRPRERTLNIHSRGLLLLMVLTMMGGLVGSPYWWMDEVRSFSWDTPPLVSRMLAAAGWSFVVVSLMALRRPSRHRLRLVLLLLFVYLVPLTVAILVFHLDRFDFSDAITYAFFAIVVFMDVAATWYLLRQPTVLPDDAADTAPTNPLTRAWMLGSAALLALWGSALFLTDSGPISVVWAWSGDLLSTRLIGVMLLTVATGLVYSFRHKDVARVMLWTTVAYGFGIAAASFWNVVADKPLPKSYFIVFSVISVTSLAVLVRESNRSESAE